MTVVPDTSYMLEIFDDGAFGIAYTRCGYDRGEGYFGGEPSVSNNDMYFRTFGSCGNGAFDARTQRRGKNGLTTDEEQGVIPQRASRAARRSTRMVPLAIHKQPASLPKSMTWKQGCPANERCLAASFASTLGPPWPK